MMSRIVQPIYRVFEFPVGLVPLPWAIMVSYHASRVTLVNPETGELGVQELEDRAPKRINPWIMRQKMLNANTEVAILRFLNEVGGCVGYDQQCLFAHFGHFRYTQDVIRAMMTSPVTHWNRLRGAPTLYNDTVTALLHPLATSVELVDHRLAVCVEAQVFMDVVTATLHIDKLRGVIYRKCARPDCTEMFRVESLHRKQYCEQYCAHLESVRRTRRELKKKATAEQKG